MKKFIKDNKLVSIIIGFLFTSIITYNILWGTWVTNQIFCHKEAIAVQIVEEKVISESVKEVKSDIKNFKKDMKEDINKVEEKMDKNQEKIMDILMKMNRNQNKMMEKNNK